MKHNTRPTLGAPRLAAIAVAAVLALGATPALASDPPPIGPGDEHYHGCGSVTTPGHPWHSRNSNGGTAWGTHWLAAYEPVHRHGGDCGWAKSKAKQLASHSAADSPRTCAWTDGNAYERFKPFRDMRCILPFRSHGKTHYVEVRVLVDPDPRFIHYGSTPAAKPASGGKIVEETPNGYLMTAKVARSGKAGHLSLSCPNGTDLGRSAKFAIAPRTRKFIAERSGSWTFAGRFDSKTHFTGHGKISTSACGPGAPAKFSEPAPRSVTWTSCPPDDVLNPYPANTPFTFEGILRGAARGTRLRIEYTDPNASDGRPFVRHVTTDAAGRFSDTHEFPNTGSEYGASATARYPDKRLAPGRVCSFNVE
jgi:hypothetical protein